MRLSVVDCLFVDGLLAVDLHSGFCFPRPFPIVSCMFCSCFPIVSWGRRADSLTNPPSLPTPALATQPPQVWPDTGGGMCASRPSDRPLDQPTQPSHHRPCHPPTPSVDRHRSRNVCLSARPLLATRSLVSQLFSYCFPYCFSSCFHFPFRLRFRGQGSTENMHKHIRSQAKPLHMTTFPTPAPATHPPQVWIDTGGGMCVWGPGFLFSHCFLVVSLLIRGCFACFPLCLSSFPVGTRRERADILRVFPGPVFRWLSG